MNTLSQFLRKAVSPTLLLGSLALIGASAQAASVGTTFYANGTFDGGDGPLTGTVVIDTTGGTVVSADLTVDGVTFNSAPVSQTFESGEDLYFASFSVPGNSLNLDIYTTGGLVGYTGGDLCAETMPDGESCSGIDTFFGIPDPPLISGSLSTTAPASSTPEPASPLMLVSGLAVIAALLQRLRHD
jgi:hypothetical protein